MERKEKTVSLTRCIIIAIKQNVVKAIKAVARGQNRYVSKLRELTFESS